ncbi:30S ribosomal protein S9 [Candidatus Woesearchaeota archaeon]|jgi:small subunit ribosomal protein S9|nr:30S ribosomal protein S9 [Candidatus Woesearchaeota archaeon]MBT7927936.1 30S ribosomal protein S9 [Candidatus Woesearchaeota archaeon]
MKTVHASGKRKRAVARATLTAGKGIVKINNLLLSCYEPKLPRLKIMEPLVIADKFARKVNISVKVNGGGQMSQAEAARLAISKALVEFSKSDSLKEEFLQYDRHLLIADTRRKETCKPGDSKARSRRQKSYR